MNVLPPPVLSALIVPPINSARLRHMGSPRPVPPCCPVSAAPVCSKGSKIRSRSSGLIPGPVSSTTKRRIPIPALSGFPSHINVILIPPFSVNLTALESRLPAIWRIFPSSPKRTKGMFPSIWSFNSRFFSAARCRKLYIR